MMFANMLWLFMLNSKVIAWKACMCASDHSLWDEQVDCACLQERMEFLAILQKQLNVDKDWAKEICTEVDAELAGCAFFLNLPAT